MIIDHTHFTGLLSVGISPNTGVSNITNDADLERLNSYVDFYETEYLRKVLGDVMCAEFMSYMEHRTGEGEKEQRWEALLEKLTERVSPIACYVYFKLIGECNYNVTSNGVQGSADGDAVSPGRLQIRAWNDMVRLNFGVYVLLRSNDYEGVCFDPYFLRTINDMGI